MMVQQSSLHTQLSSGVVHKAQRHVLGRRTNTHSVVKVQAIFGTNKKNDQELENMMEGFVFDPSMQRWVRSKNRQVDPAQLVVTPKSGMPYTVAL